MGATTTKNLDDAKAKRDLLQAYIEECERIDRYTTSQHIAEPASEFGVTGDERLEVFERRRDRLYNELTNKGIKLLSDAGADTLPSIARALEQQSVAAQ